MVWALVYHRLSHKSCMLRAIYFLHVIVTNYSAIVCGVPVFATVAHQTVQTPALMYMVLHCMRQIALCIGLFLLTQFACEQLHRFIFLLEMLCVHIMTSHPYD